MSTPTYIIIEAFLKRIEKDRDFFQYINMSDEASMELALRRAKNYLIEAVGNLSLRGCNQIDLTAVDEELEEFNIDLTSREIFLIASIMYQIHLDRDISKLKMLSVNYTSTDLRVFDPSNARKTFLEMYDFVCIKNDHLIDEYINRDRLTGKLIGIDFASYDE